MSEEKNEVELDVNNPDSNKNTEEVKSNFLRFTGSLSGFIKEVTNIREDTDVDETIASIKKDIDFKGHNVWILVFSIFIASIGLNVNSTAVVIGAMLISPLMGPILGVGLSIGTNDWKTLLRSLKSLGVATGASIAASTLYFLITPLDEASSEILARTKPTLLDAFIAFFGGLALIVARTKKGTIASVIFGVAIATALMPPLCTAGFGIATGNFQYFFGAFYLFLLNSIFICIATLIIVRFIRFPVVEFVDATKEKKAKSYIVFFLMIVLIPSWFIFWDVIKESVFRQKSETYISENFVFDKTSVNMKKISYNDTLGTIEVSLSGDLISKEQIDYLKARMEFYDLTKVLFIDNAISRVQLKVYQSNDNSDEIQKLREDIGQYRADYIEEQFHKNLEVINEKNRKIKQLLVKIDRLKGDSIPIQKLNKEIQLQYSSIDGISMGNTVSLNTTTNSLDTITTAVVTWKEDVSAAKKEEEYARLRNWLKVRLDLDTVKFVRN